ncbi:MAG: hypothetical protein GPOALKHO_001269 [Sodalis sp.]|nr:MAG: hypothetical protein GPOALKHO_001269 [Sodalis sp.]
MQGPLTGHFTRVAAKDLQRLLHCLKLAQFFLHFLSLHISINISSCVLPCIGRDSSGESSRGLLIGDHDKRGFRRHLLGEVDRFAGKYEMIGQAIFQCLQTVKARPVSYLARRWWVG